MVQIAKIKYSYNFTSISIQNKNFMVILLHGEIDVYYLFQILLILKRIAILLSKTFIAIKCFEICDLL